MPATLHDGADNLVAAGPGGLEDGRVDDEQPDGDGLLSGPVPASYDEGWRWLVDDLATWCRVVDPSPGALVLDLPRPEGVRRVEVRMTPQQWDDAWAVIHGSVAEGLAWVRDQLARCDAPYAVLDLCELLHPSVAPELPRDP